MILALTVPLFFLLLGAMVVGSLIQNRGLDLAERVDAQIRRDNAEAFRDLHRGNR